MPELQPFPLVTRSGKSGRVFRASRFLDRSNVNRVEFDDGTSTTVLASELHVNPDGTFVLDDEPSAPAASVQAASAAAPERGAGFLGSVVHGPGERRAERLREEARQGRPLEAAEAAPVVAPEHDETLAMETAPPEELRETFNLRAQAVEPPVQRIERQPADRRIVIDQPVFTEDVDVQRIAVNRLVDSRPETRQEGDTTVIPVVEEVVTVQKRLLLREEVRITRRRVEVVEPRRVMLEGEGTQVFGSDGRKIDLQ